MTPHGNTHVVCEEKVGALLSKYLPQDGLYAKPDIPEEILDSARAACELPDDEEVLGVIDFTMMGTAKQCLVFGRKGIYFNNLYTSKTPGSGKVSCNEFGKHGATDTGFHEIKISARSFIDLTSSAMPKEKVLDLLNELARIIRSEHRPHRRRKHHGDHHKTGGHF